MAGGKKHTAEQIVNLQRQVEVGGANGKKMPQACKEAENVMQTHLALAPGRWLPEGGPGSAAKGAGASNDLAAIGAMGAIHDAGLRIPEDVSMTGIDDIA